MLRNVWYYKDFLNISRKAWELEMNASGEKLGEVNYSRGIFQGDN